MNGWRPSMEARRCRGWCRGVGVFQKWVRGEGGQVLAQLACLLISLDTKVSIGTLQTLDPLYSQWVQHHMLS